ncbi:MAG: hypothetical protein M1822_000796 [Bathelium mastoideum]|nr:MAG: hypothetical protein M1822_000796 [Bathelium mastoideum]
MEHTSLENSISAFFTASGTDATRQECDKLAMDLAGEPVVPVPAQGACSYTTVAGPERTAVFQFRSPQEPAVDSRLLDLIKHIHEDLVATTVHYGIVGNNSPLHVYLMERLPGKTHLEARLARASPNELSEQEETFQSNTVLDLGGRFVAELKNAQTLPSSDLLSLRAEYEHKLEILQESLPEPFKGIVIGVKTNLDSLFNDWPLALSHEDLTEGNVLVDPATGHLTGVIDWVNAKIAPFGVSLYGMESFMGAMGQEGWIYYKNAQQMRASLQELLETAMAEALPGLSLAEGCSKLALARKMGILLHYGFFFETGVPARPVQEGEAHLKYLEAFLL